MILWFVLTALSCAASVLIAIPLIRRYEVQASQRAPDAGFYQDQLRQVERDRAAGVISPGEADLAAIEIQRRLLAAAKSLDVIKPVNLLWRRAALALMVAAVAVGGTSIYAYNGRPDLAVPLVQAESNAAVPAVSLAQTSGDVDGKIAGLAARMQQNPGDAEGWRMLGWSYFNTQRYDEAATAYAKAMALQPANNDFQSAYAEALVQSAQGQVTPAAEAAFEAVLKRDPKDQRSRFYMALAREQAGDLGQALDLWTSLLADASADAGWLPDVKAHIADLGARTGRDVSKLAPAQQIPQSGATPGLAGQDQAAAVASMISKLASKLESNPVDRDGWAMMIRSLAVTRDKAGAAQALAKAQSIFANDPSTRTQIEAMARSLGITSETAAEPAPEDMAAVAALPPQDQQSMIRGMVDGLAGRLATSPHDAEGWMRLIRSRMVLNEPDLAREALRNAMAEFSGDNEASGRIAEAARSLGLAVE
jgi:cytochrome c-type biogenesis protein CcmH